MLAWFVNISRVH